MALDPWPLTTLQARHFIFQDKPLSLAVKNLPAIQEIHILSLRQESPGGGNGNLLQYSCQKISRTEQPGGLQSLGSQIHRQNWSNWACINLLYHEIPQKTPKSLLQYHSSKASIFRCSAFFIVQLSHPYISFMTNGKLENSERDGNTRPPDLPLEESLYRSGNNSSNWPWKNRLISNRKRSSSRLSIVMLLI